MMVGRPVEAEGSFPGRERLGTLHLADILLGAGILLEVRPGKDLLKKEKIYRKKQFYKVCDVHCTVMNEYVIKLDGVGPVDNRPSTD